MDKTPESGCSKAEEPTDGDKKSQEEDLTELLNSALSDFGKSVPSGSGLDGGGATASGGDGGPIIDPKMAQQAATEFQHMLRQLAEVQKAVVDQVQTGTEAVSLSGPTPTEGDAQFAESLLLNLNLLADKAGRVSNAQNDDEFLQAMGDLHKNDTYENEFLPFMQGLMGSLLSKDMMYPALKEMTEKYPEWLEQNKEKVSEEERGRYEKQLGLMREALAEYDAETDADSDQVVSSRFQKLVFIMQQMQMCGHPPAELVGGLPPGFSLDELSGLPQVVDSKQAAESCTLM